MYANKMPSNQQKGLSFFLTAGGSLACGVPDPKGWVPCTTECPLLRMAGVWGSVK